MFSTFPMPVKPYTHKYLVFHFGLDYKITQLDHFGIYLMELLRRPWDRRRCDEFLSAYTAKFPMNYRTLEFLNTGRVNFTSENIITFNNFVEMVVKAEFHGYVEANLLPGSRLNKVIEDYRQQYGWTDDDISLDTLTKSFQRYRKKKQTRINSSKSLGSLSSSYARQNHSSAAA